MELPETELDRLQLDSLQLDSLQLNSLQLISLQLGSLQLDPEQARTVGCKLFISVHLNCSFSYTSSGKPSKFQQFPI